MRQHGARRRPPPVKSSPTRAESVFVRALVFSLVALPVLNASTIDRLGGSLSLRAPMGVVLGAYLVLLLITLLTTLTSPLHERPSLVGKTAPLIALMALIVWLGLAFLRVGDLTAARNLFVIVVTLATLALAAARGHALVRSLHASLRVFAVLSAIAWLWYPGWYLNAPEYFSGDGKIFENLANAQGLLSHGNYSGLLLGAAAVLELPSILDRRHRVRAAAFLVLAVALQLGTQARNSLIATGIALVAVAVLHYGRRFAPKLLPLVGLALSLVPLAIMTFGRLLGSSPDFRDLSALSTRPQLWQGVYVILPDYFLLGAGSNGIVTARAFVTDEDVTEVTHAHNAPLTLLLFGGVIALALYAWLATASTLSASRAPDTAWLGMVTILIFTGITESPITPYVTQVGVVLWVITVAGLSTPGARRIPEVEVDTASLGDIDSKYSPYRRRS